MGIYYLSFQRPPPLAVRAGEGVKVCLSITNDLRSETYFPASSSTSSSSSVRLRLVWLARSVGAGDGGEEEGEEENGKRLVVLPERITPGAELAWTDGGCAFRVVDGLLAPRSVGSAAFKGGSEVYLGVYADAASSVGAASTALKGKLVARRTPARNEDGKVDARLVHDIANNLDSKEGDEGDIFVPVLSGPITVLQPNQAQAQGQVQSGGKQNVLLRRIGLPRSSATSSKARRHEVVIQEETGSELDKHIWDASLHLLRHVTLDEGTSGQGRSQGGQKLPARPRLLDRIEAARRQGLPFNIVELGAGTGIVSIALARWLRTRLASSLQEQEVPLLAAEEDHDKAKDAKEAAECEPTPPMVNIYATDLESAVPLMNTNLHHNSLGLAQSSTSITVQPLVLDWTTPLPAELTARTTHVDLVLVSDCTYNPTFYPALARTMRALLSFGGELNDEGDDIGNGRDTSSPRQDRSCVLAKKHRHADERGLWSVLQAHELSFALIDGHAHEEEADGEGQEGGEERWGIWEVRLTSGPLSREADR